MDLTQGTLQEKTNRAKKMMLWFGMISMFMTFAGLTSAIVVSKSRTDWDANFELPNVLFFGTLVIFLSSITIQFAQKLIKKQDHSLGMIMLVITLLLGLLFIYFQYDAFYYFYEVLKIVAAGDMSNVAFSFLFILGVLHLAHLVSGIIVLLVLIYNHYKQRYKVGQTLGLELGVQFWHFLDFLWLFLFLFFYFVR